MKGRRRHLCQVFGIHALRYQIRNARNSFRAGVIADPSWFIPTYICALHLISKTYLFSKYLLHAYNIVGTRQKSGFCGQSAGGTKFYSLSSTCSTSSSSLPRHCLGSGPHYHDLHWRRYGFLGKGETLHSPNSTTTHSFKPHLWVLPKEGWSNGERGEGWAETNGRSRWGERATERLLGGKQTNKQKLYLKIVFK